MKKTVFSLLLVLVLLIGVLPMTALAAETDVSVSNNVIDITDATVYSLTSSAYVKTTNITISGATVLSATEDGKTVHVKLADDTAPNAEVTATFGLAVGRPMTGSQDVTTVELVDGKATMTVVVTGAWSSRKGTVTYTINFEADVNVTEPPAVNGEAQRTAEAKTTIEQTYPVSEYFGPASSYYLVENGGYTEIGKTYTKVWEEPGTHDLVFAARNKIGYSENVTVTVTVTAIPLYDVSVTVPENCSPVFYAVKSVENGTEVKGAELTYADGVVKVPENISRIMWEAEGLLCTSVPVSAGAALELVRTTFAVTCDDTGAADSAATVTVQDAAGCKVSGTAADTYLLPAVSGIKYTVAASSSSYNGVTLNDQTPANGAVPVTVTLKHFKVIAPAGSVVSAGTLSGSFSYSFAAPLAEPVTDAEAGTVTYKFAPLSGAAFIRVQRPNDPDAVTYWDYKSSKADGKTITVTEAMLFMNDDGTEGEFNADTIYRNFEYYSFDLGDVYMNINNQGYIDLDVGEVKALNMFRNWQAINSYTNDKIAVPDFEYEIINLEGDHVISIVPNAQNSGAATLTAEGEGTAIVLVTYDAMYSELTATGSLGGQGGGNRLSAIWPDRTGVFVVSVGKDGTAIQSNMTCNGAIFDAEHSPQFYHGNEGASVSFIPEEGVTVTVNRGIVAENKLSFGAFTADGVSVNAETGEVTVSGLTSGRHIIRLEKDGVAAYQVVTATQTTVTMTDSEGNEISLEEKLEPGQTVNITVTGLTNPAEKFATKYNFNCQITYKDQFGNGYSNSSGATYGKYDFSSIPQTVTVTIPEDWTEENLTLNGFMKMGGFAGDGIGSHRTVSYGDNRGMANGADAGMELGTLPEIVLNVAQSVSVIYGDVDGDGEVTSMDATYAYAIYNDMYNGEVTEEMLVAADVDGDGEVSSMDATYIYGFYNGVITEFPVEAN